MSQSKVLTTIAENLCPICPRSLFCELMDTAYVGSIVMCTHCLRAAVSVFVAPREHLAYNEFQQVIGAASTREYECMCLQMGPEGLFVYSSSKSRVCPPFEPFYAPDSQALWGAITKPIVATRVASCPACDPTTWCTLEWNK